MLTDLIPTPWKWLGLGLAALITAAIGAAGGWTLCSHLLTPRLDAAMQSSARWQAAYADLTAASSQQNTAIEALAANATLRAKQARQALQAAQASAQDKLTRASLLLRATAPGNATASAADLCQAASAAFDEELTLERGQP